MHNALLTVNGVYVFRGGGFISLENLLFFARNFPVSLYFNYSCPNYFFFFGKDSCPNYLNSVKSNN